jgi:hypothetical protein
MKKPIISSKILDEYRPLSQREEYFRMCTSGTCLVSGPAGSGKSIFIDYIVEKAGKRMFQCADFNLDTIDDVFSDVTENEISDAVLVFESSNIYGGVSTPYDIMSAIVNKSRESNVPVMVECMANREQYLGEVIHQYHHNSLFDVVLSPDISREGNGSNWVSVSTLKNRYGERIDFGFDLEIYFARKSR